MTTTKAAGKLDAVLARLCERMGYLHQFQAAKLPYLINVVALHELGEPVTESTARAYQNGVVDEACWHRVRELEEDDPLFRNFAEGGVRASEHAVTLNGGDFDSADLLSKEELEIVDAVAEVFRSASSQELGPFTKRMNPEIGSWDDPDLREEVMLTEDAYALMSDYWQSLYQELFELTPEELLDDDNWTAVEEPVKKSEEELDRALSERFGEE